MVLASMAGNTLWGRLGDRDIEMQRPRKDGRHCNETPTPQIARLLPLLKLGGIFLQLISQAVEIEAAHVRG